jgi:hypothetical protein
MRSWELKATALTITQVLFHLPNTLKGCKIPKLAIICWHIKNGRLVAFPPSLATWNNVWHGMFDPIPQHGIYTQSHHNTQLLAPPAKESIENW